MNEELHPPSYPALFCIDSDGTLIGGHTHNAILEAAGRDPTILTQPEAQWDIVKNMPPIGKDPQAWRDLFHTVVTDGHKIAMVSFSEFGSTIIPRYLHEIIGLERDFIAKHIAIVSFLPEDQSNKHPHIAQAKIITETTHLLPHKIVLMDNEHANIRHATLMGHSTILATPNGEHIAVAQNRSKSIKNLPNAAESFSSENGSEESSEEDLAGSRNALKKSRIGFKLSTTVFFENSPENLKLDGAGTEEKNKHTHSTVNQKTY